MGCSSFAGLTWARLRGEIGQLVSKEVDERKELMGYLRMVHSKGGEGSANGGVRSR